jgi:hypothetical protein
MASATHAGMWMFHLRHAKRIRAVEIIRNVRVERFTDHPVCF